MPTQQILDLVGSRGQVHCTFLQRFLLSFPPPSVHLNVMPFAMWSFIGALGTYPGSLRCCAKIPLWVLFGTWYDWRVLFTMWLFAYFLAWVRTLAIPTVPNSGRPSGRFWVMWSYLVSRSYVGRGIFCNEYHLQFAGYKKIFSIFVFNFGVVSSFWSYLWYKLRGLNSITGQG